MKRLLFAVCAVLVVAVTAPLISNLNAQDIFGDSAMKEKASPVVADVADKPAKSPKEEREALAKEFVELIKSRSEMMTKEELQQAIKAATVENNRIAARRELEKVKTLLTDIAEKHPNTPAGRAAATGFNAISQALAGGRREVIFDRPLTPEPDDMFNDPSAAYERPAPSNNSRRRARLPEVIDDLDAFGEPSGGKPRSRTKSKPKSSKAPAKKGSRPANGSNNDLFGDGF